MGFLVRNALIAVAAVLAVVLGPHMFLMVALTTVLAVVVFLAWRIDVVTMQTGWRIVPVRRTATASW